MPAGQDFPGNAVGLSLEVVCLVLLETSCGSLHRGSLGREFTQVWQDRVELLRCKPFPVRFTATGGKTGAYYFDQDECLACPASAPEAAQDCASLSNPCLGKGLGHPGTPR